jgi:hypothetical protein
MALFRLFLLVICRTKVKEQVLLQVSLVIKSVIIANQASSCQRYSNRIENSRQHAKEAKENRDRQATCGEESESRIGIRIRASVKDPAPLFQNLLAAGRLLLIYPMNCTPSSKLTFPSDFETRI